MIDEKQPRSRPGIVLHCLLLLILLVSLGWTTVPQLLRLLREARALQPLSRAARRARVDGPIVASIEQVKRALPPGEPVALIGPPLSYSHLVFANYYGYPWTSRNYADLDLYRLIADDPLRPKAIVVVSDTGARLATYMELRDERLRGGRLAHESPRPAPLRFAIPLVGSLDGPAPDTYVTEGEVANDGEKTAHLRLSLMPEGIVRTITIPPHGSVAFYDLLVQLFGMMDVRWVSAESDRPLRAGFWFVNHGRNQSAPLPLVTNAANDFLLCPAEECKVWLLNLTNGDTTVIASGAPVPLPAHGLLSRPFRGGVMVSDAWNLFVFASTKEPPTRFVWPRGVTP